MTLGDGPPQLGKALRFDKDATFELPARPAEVDKPFTIATWVWIPKEKNSFVIAKQSEEPKDGKEHGWTISVNGGAAGRERPRSRITLRARMGNI